MREREKAIVRSPDDPTPLPEDHHLLRDANDPDDWAWRRAIRQRPAALAAYRVVVLALGVVLILGGFFFKLAACPMHFWVPDIYQGASNETTAFIATIPKIGAVALLIRFLALPSGHPQFLVHLLAGVASVRCSTAT